MQITFLNHSFEELSSLDTKDCVMALGFFDGIHLGHQHIIRKAKEIAEKKQLQFSLMTFTPHPSEVINPSHGAFPYLTPFHDKLQKLASLGVEQLYIVRFDIPFSRLSPQEFVKYYITGLKCKHVVAGFDFTFGYRGGGNMTQLANDYHYEFEVTSVAKVEHNNQKISSTLIRKLISSGDVDLIPDYLGHYYEITGQVIGNPMHPNLTFGKLSVITDGYLPESGVYTIVAEINNQSYEGTCRERFSLDSHCILILDIPHCPECDEATSIQVKWICRDLSHSDRCRIPVELSFASV